MGLLDFDVRKITENPAFMLGSQIHGANTGHYGEFGPAIGQGMQNYTRQMSLLEENKRRQQELNQLNQYRQAQMQQQIARQKQAQMQQQKAQMQQQREQGWIAKNYPGMSGAPQFAQQQAIKQRYQAPPKPTAFDQKLGLYKKDPGTYKAMFPGQQTSINNYMGGKLSPGQEAYDKEFGKDLAQFEAGGGYADQAKNISQLDDVVNALSDENKNITGPIIGNTPEWMLEIANPQAVDIRQQVEEVVQRNLREVLGAQFTEKEGERLIARAYNPNLPEEINRDRVSRLVTAIKQAYDQKQQASQYFKENQTLRGFKGKVPKLKDFYNVLDSGTSTATDGPMSGWKWEE